MEGLRLTVLSGMVIDALSMLLVGRELGVDSATF